MLGWIFSIAMMIVYAREPSAVARPELLIAAGLFAIAGSVGYGMMMARSRSKEKDEEK